MSVVSTTTRCVAIHCEALANTVEGYIAVSVDLTIANGVTAANIANAFYYSPYSPKLPT